MTIDKIYWDSVTFLAWLQNENGRVDHCADVLQSAQEGRVKIITSAFTLAEVLKMRKQAPIPRNEQDKVTAFFKNEYIVVRNVTRRVAEFARGLVWDNGIDPKDAIHVATAIDDRLTMLHTFDEGLLKKSGSVGDPPLKIETPFIIEPKLRLAIPDLKTLQH